LLIVSDGAGALIENRIGMRSKNIRVDGMIGNFMKDKTCPASAKTSCQMKEVQFACYQL